MQADINGPQRKILSASVRPLKASHGTTGIAIRDGMTLPFVVTREWSAPEGYYAEQWFLVDPETSEVLFEGPLEERLIWGLQSRTECRDEVTEPVALAPGRYQIVFGLGGLRGGDVDVEAIEAPAEAA
ncbi:MAG: hypothetical protein M3N53_07470 [Actinomycetota bacterium]|nr:hypothetical protein [Actinomycetota bacterium]